jgi:hypothetical protein
MHENEVHIFWRMFRNGMLHRGMPAKVGGWTWEFETGKASPIRWDNNHLFVDPWCFRDLVLKLLNDNKKAWADHLFPIAKVYVESKK